VSAAPTGRAWVDPRRCQGHGQCYAWFPELFGEGVDGHAAATGSPLDEHQAEDVRTAANRCPESAISLQEDA
jgi:ferredoxin